MGDVARSDWNGLLQARGTPEKVVTVQVPLRRSPTGGSGKFLAEGDDEQQWWIKPPNTPQGGKVIVTEHVVGRLGILIGSPVCTVAIARVPNEVAGWEFRNGHQLQPGYASASKHVADAVENKKLRSRRQDDNPSRHVGVYALYDWCWGGDGQWLYVTNDQNRTFSHDHGWYFPPTGAEWESDELLAQVSEPHELPVDASGLDGQRVEETAARLDGITRDEIKDALLEIPSSWPATDAELETLGYFLEARAPGVAKRLRSLAGGP